MLLHGSTKTAVMKKLVLFFILFFVAYSVFAQEYDLSKAELRTILQKCIDLPQLQSYIPVDESGNPKQIYVYYFAPHFLPTDVELSKGINQVPFREVATKLSDINEDFLIFDRLHTQNNQGEIIFRFHSNTTVINKVVYVKIALLKEANNWTLSNPQITQQ